MIIIFMGIQGSGKGTQAQLFCKEKNYTHINLGELLRAHVSQKTDIGIKANGYISQGLLVPDEVVFEVIEDAINKPATGQVLDGFPRTTAQAEFLAKRHKIHRVIYLDLPDEKAKERMLARRSCPNCKIEYNLLSKPPQKADTCDVCGGPLVARADDTEALIQNRIDLFHQETKPLIDYYEAQGILAKVNAYGSISDIHNTINELVK